MSSWLKWRTKWAWGFGEWRYIHISSIYDDDIGECLMEICRANNECVHSDKFRGVEWEEIIHPPLEWVREEIENTSSRLKGIKNWLDILSGVLSDIKVGPP